MNIWLKLLIGIGGFIFLSVLYSLIINLIYLVKESNKIRMYSSRTRRIDLLANIYTTASNVYMSFAQKGIALIDYAYLAEVVIYGMVKELGGDTTTLLQKIQQFMNKPKDSQDGSKPIIIPSPKPKEPKDNKKQELTDKYINDIIDKWEKENPDWKNKGKKEK